jgi:anti-anti-sigma factor
MIEFINDTLANGVGVIRPIGRLNMVSAPHLGANIEALINGGTVRLVVDLAGTDFIDSSGLGALITGLKKSRQAGGDLRLANPTPQIKAVLEMTNLNRVLQPVASVEEAY